MTKNQCPCPGPLCGDQTYDEMFEVMKQRYITHNQSEHDLRKIHLKWKKLAAEMR